MPHFDVFLLPFTLLQKKSVNSESEPSKTLLSSEVHEVAKGKTKSHRSIETVSIVKFMC